MRLTLRRRKAEPQRRGPTPPPAELLPDYEPVESADPLAEIDELMEANRRSPDAGRERRIVQLRHEAFAQLSAEPPQRAPVGDVPENGLPKPEGLAEIKRDELSAEAIRDGILGEGSLVIRGLLDEADSHALREGIDETFSAREEYLAGADRAATAPWFDPFAPGPEHPLNPAQWNRMEKGGHAVWAPDSPRMMFLQLDAFERSGLRDVVSSYLGERPVLSMNKSVLRRVSPDSGTGWHQDGAFLGRGIRTCNVWIALSRCGDVAPGLDIVGRRYEEVVETGTEGALFPWAASPAKVEETRGGAPIVRPVFEPGDAVLFDHLCMHRTAIGEGMTEDRYATETWCFAPSVYPDKTVPLVL